MNCIVRNRSGARPVTLARILQNANILEIMGSNTTSLQNIYIKGTTIAALTDIAYIFVVMYGYISIWKVKNNAVVTTAILASATTNRCGIYENTSTHNIYYRSTSTYTSGTGTGSTSSGTIALISFPAFDETTLDTWFASLTPFRANGTSSTSSQTVGTYSLTGVNNALTKDATIMTVGAYLDFWVPSGSTMRKIAGTATDAGSVTSTQLQTINSYSHSIIGLTANV